MYFVTFDICILLQFRMMLHLTFVLFYTFVCCNIPHLYYFTCHVGTGTCPVEGKTRFNVVPLGKKHTSPRRAEQWDIPRRGKTEVLYSSYVEVVGNMQIKS